MSGLAILLVFVRYSFDKGIDDDLLLCNILVLQEMVYSMPLMIS